MKILLYISFIVSLSIIGIRVGGVTDTIFKDIAHIWIGFTIGGATFDRESRIEYILITLTLIVVEVGTALVQRGIL